MNPTLFLAGMILCMTTSQVLLKYAGIYAATYVNLVDSFLFNPWLWSALCASGVGMFCWMLTLRHLPLSVAYPWTALIYGITPLLAAWLFSEILTGRYAIGLMLIFAGVLLTSRGVTAE